jgi:tetratricopeptide (TPR) repeat protein
VAISPVWAQGTNLAEVDRRLLEDLGATLCVPASHVGHPAVARFWNLNAGFVEAFRRAGLEIEVAAPDEIGKWVAGRLEAVEIASYLDLWAVSSRHQYGSPANAFLLKAARVADPDPWRDSLRASVGQEDGYKVLLRASDDQQKLDELPSASSILLARLLVSELDDQVRASRVLHRARVRHPEDGLVAIELALRAGAEHPIQENPATWPQGEELVQLLKDAVATRPWSGYVRIMQGDALWRMNRFDEAVAVYREAIRIHPGLSTALTRVGKALWELNRRDEAIAAHREAVKTAPDDPVAHSFLGAGLLLSGRYDEAVVELRESIRLEPNEVQSHALLGDALWSQGNRHEAIDQWARVIAEYEVGRSGPELAGSILKKLVDRVAGLRDTIRMKPDDVEAHRLLGRLLGLQTAGFPRDENDGRLYSSPQPRSNEEELRIKEGVRERQRLVDESIVEMRTVIRLNPTEVKYRIDLGYTELDRDRRDEALKIFREAIRIRPDDPETHIALFDALTRSSDLLGEPKPIPDEAVKEYCAVIRLVAGEPPLSGRLEAFIEYRPGPFRIRSQLDEVVSAYRDVARVKPGDSRLQENLGDVLMRHWDNFRDRAQLVEAVSAYREAARGKPGDSRLQMALGHALMEHWREFRDPVRLDEAVSAYREVVQRDPENMYFVISLVKSLVEQGKLDEAIKVFREGRRRVSFVKGQGFESFELGLCKTLVERGKVQEAINLLRERARRFPGEADVQTQLGDSLARLGKLDEAETAYREAIQIATEKKESGGNKERSAAARNGLGEILWKKGLRDQALSEFIRVKNARDVFGPESKRALENLEAAVVELRASTQLRPNDSTLYYQLGRSLEATLKKFGGEDFLFQEGRNTILAEELKARFQVVPAFRKAIQLDPKNYEAHESLGYALLDQGKKAEAEKELRAVIRLKPDSFDAHMMLSLCVQEEPAIKALRAARDLKPHDRAACNWLVSALGRIGRVDEAIAVCRDYLRAEPYDLIIHYNLAMTLQDRGDLDGALAEFRLDGECRQASDGGRRYGEQIEAEEIQRLKRMIAARVRIPAIIKGTDRGKDPNETLELAQMCHSMRFYAAATRLYVDAFSATKGHYDYEADRQFFKAVRCAVLAGCSQGLDDPPPDAGTREGFRRQALAWLKLKSASTSSGDEAARWKGEPDLAGVRDPEGLAKLPETERAEWKEFWATLK